MRYHYKKQKYFKTLYGENYLCNHPVYDKRTLFKINNKGLSVIQQRYNPMTKKTWWGPIDQCLNNSLYLNENFKKYFDERSDKPVNGIYPTVTIRQIMWALRMKPLKKERWEHVLIEKIFRIANKTNPYMKGGMNYVCSILFKIFI